ncbi:hypothetical protein L227DRAFT_299396 [Lentinus tigrinus ALCF2SS1-6]|uniref:Uncharacterized protein n=1 Tax=Lentinus tigrinus ALCF2SS1-6 TaxID=1328759 RepID=A0A5C2RXD8_9APHY|nr:hypothetical protein L227DRAFT_299396 [Lentinus tigrinus ALCF2SS1-6]
MCRTAAGSMPKMHRSSVEPTPQRMLAMSAEDRQSRDGGRRSDGLRGGTVRWKVQILCGVPVVVPTVGVLGLIKICNSLRWSGRTAECEDLDSRGRRLTRTATLLGAFGGAFLRPRHLQSLQPVLAQVCIS